MAIPADVTARARAALSMLRDDRADIVRFDSDAGEDIRVYTGLPCHLSRTTLPPQSGEDTAAVSTVRYTLYLAPETELRQGDAVTVTHRGQTIRGAAGPPLRGALSLAVTLESVVVS
ncbi:hypothetical protein [Anaerotruncus massiliensis (ex Togo et al. 2019)]|nr:hypothetical protein [Anaerotruncus massiliensis (ex Togo et al. 2019)]